MDPTVKRLASGQASQSWIVVRTKNKGKKQHQKANKPNNKENLEEK
jgi:hypothetical protein